MWKKPNKPSHIPSDVMREKMAIGIRSEINQLRAEKERILQRNNELRCKLNELPAGTNRSIRNYKLTNFNRRVQEDRSIIYSASNEDKNYSFKLSVTMKDSKIVKVDICLSENSALLEIQNILDILSEQCCPQTILFTIQQFIQMCDVRIRLLQKMATLKKVCRGFAPRFVNGKPVGLGVSSITAHKISTSGPPSVILELEWTMQHDKYNVALCHQFTINKADLGHPGVKAIVEQLKEKYTYKNQKLLIQNWENFFRSLV